MSSLLPIFAVLGLGCARGIGPEQGVTTVVVEPPPGAAAGERRLLDGCRRVNPTCTYRALAAELGRAEGPPAYCEGRLPTGAADPVGRVRVEGLAHLDGPASWDILGDLETLARGTLHTCYLEGLRVDPGLAGTLELELQVEAARSCVSQVRITASSLGDVHTRDCVVAALENYPLPSAGSLLAARLVFEPSS